MLLFIQINVARCQLPLPISKHRMLLFILNIASLEHNDTLFQNIVCYCLSQPVQLPCLPLLISKHRMLLFIADMSSGFSEQLDNFKTSYVTVYHKVFRKRGACIANFKTSYVTVYQNWKIPRKHTNSLSKHRMLLFIRSLLLQLTVSWKHFKTSYVTVYRGEPCV